MVTIHLVASSPTLQVIPTHAFADELVAAFATDVVERSVNQLTLRVGAEVPLSLFVHVGSSNGLLKVRIYLSTYAECTPVAGCGSVNASVLLVASLHVVQQSFGATEYDAARNTFLVISFHGGIVVLTLLDGIACHHLGLFCTTYHPSGVEEEFFAGKGIEVHVAILLGELLDA